MNNLGLSSIDWDLLLRGAKRIIFKKNDVLMKEGVESQRIFQLVRGYCRIEKVPPFLSLPPFFSLPLPSLSFSHPYPLFIYPPPFPSYPFPSLPFPSPLAPFISLPSLSFLPPLSSIISLLPFPYLPAPLYPFPPVLLLVSYSLL